MTTFYYIFLQDPLAADNDTNQMVLAPISKLKEEEREHGVFYDDDYNYLQHMKDRNVVEHDWSEADRFVMNAEERQLNKLQLPASVFGTQGQEEEVGLLNKAAPRGLDLSLDPDIVATMDEDFNFDDPDNEFEDDFIMQMNGGAAGQDDEDYDYEGDDDGEWEDDSDDCAGGRSDDEEDDKVPSLVSWSGEETKTRFTNYSMSSSVIRRNAQLETLDDKFEKFMDQYDEAEEGALECEEIEGFMDENGARMKELTREHAVNKAKLRQQLDQEREIIHRTLMEDSDEEAEDLEIVKVEDKGKHWDCESILSTYSTLYNHPKLISEPKNNKIQLSSKTGIPKGVLGRGLTAGALKQLDQLSDGQEDDDVMSIKSKISELSVRPKHETPEEKRDRKSQLKQARKERREEKKANSEAFKMEKKMQEKILMNNKNNLQGIKIC